MKDSDAPPPYDSLDLVQTPAPTPPRPSSWLPLLSFSSSRPAKQVRQTVLALVRDLVLNAESPDLLDSCASACRSYGLDLSALLQEPFIERHSAIYWAILNNRDALLSSLLVHAAPLSHSTLAEVRLACLSTANQLLFQSLRCRRHPFTTPLTTSPGSDTLVLGSLPADEVSIRESEGRGAFVAEMRINLWQKRMRVSGRVSVEFIARGRIWSLTFFSPPSTTEVGVWHVALYLLEHSPSTFIDARLVIESPAPSSGLPPPSDLIALSPLPGESSPVVAPAPSHSKSESKSRASGPGFHVRLKTNDRLAYRTSYLDALSSRRNWTPPHVQRWYDDDHNACTSAIVVPLTDGAGSQFLYEDSPFIAADGALQVRLEAQLEKPGQSECVIC